MNVYVGEGLLLPAHNLLSNAHIQKNTYCVMKLEDPFC